VSLSLPAGVSERLQSKGSLSNGFGNLVLGVVVEWDTSASLSLRVCGVYRA
jgi:hypothetical protein